MLACEFAVIGLPACGLFCAHVPIVQDSATN